MPKITLQLKGYIPLSQNALKGAHWTIHHREKRRAALALYRALESDSSCEVEGHWIGTIPVEEASSGYRICWLRLLELSLLTDGTYSKGMSRRSKPIAPKTKEPL